MSENSALEKLYTYHHVSERGRNFMVLGEDRGKFLRQNIGTGKCVLDIGCRDGELTATYADGNDVTGLDIDSGALQIASQKIQGFHGRQVDLNGDWGVEPNTFDAVVACEVIEHLYYPHNVCAKISDALKHGGMLVGTIPHAFSLQVRIKYLFGIKRSTPLADPTHINHFSRKEFRDILNKHFTNVMMHGLCTRRYYWLNKIFPFWFAHTLMFTAVKPKE